MNYCPLSQIDDGVNDVYYQNANEAGRVAAAAMCILADDGALFNQKGDILDCLKLNYLKTNEWTLDPGMKGTPPKDFKVTNSLLETAPVYDSRALFSIDGERYPAQKLQAKVIKSFLPIHF